MRRAPEILRDSVGVYVVGMHRSGTSVATRLLNLCGVPTCVSGDLLNGVKGNIKGLWESATLVRFNDALLHALGAAWWCPPRPTAWMDHPSIACHADLGRSVFASVHPTSQWVWKDPRTCVTLPYWLRSLDARPVVVLMVRNPLDISKSLKRRDKFGEPLSVALWERYFQHALPHMRHLPVLVTRYDDVLHDPVKWCRSTAAFLTAQGVALDPRWDPDLVRQFVDPSLRHHECRDPLNDQSPLSASQKRLYELLLTLSGSHERLDMPRLPIETPQTDRLFAQLRSAHRVWAPTSNPFQPFERLSGAAPMRARPAVARPPVSIVVISRNEGTVLRRTVSRLINTAPREAEIIVVDDASTDGSADFLAASMPRVCLRRSVQPLGVSGARNLGAIEARGTAIVFSDAHVQPAPGWFEPLAHALARPGVGAVGPTVTSVGPRRVAVRGLTFVDDALNVQWLRRYSREPYPIPLMPGCFMAVRRDVFHTVGGFDAGMAGYGSEDLELCVRLWRLGFECLAVPASEVKHRFRTHTRSQINWESFLLNLLRLGLVHLSAAHVTRFVDTLRGHASFERAMARVLVTDTLRRRTEFQSASLFDDSWFLRRFGVRIFNGAGSASGNGRSRTGVEQ